MLLKDSSFLQLQKKLLPACGFMEAWVKDSNLSCQPEFPRACMLAVAYFFPGGKKGQLLFINSTLATGEDSRPAPMQHFDLHWFFVFVVTHGAMIYTCTDAELHYL